MDILDVDGNGVPDLLLNGSVNSAMSVPPDRKGGPTQDLQWTGLNLLYLEVDEGELRLLKARELIPYLDGPSDARFGKRHADGSVEVFAMSSMRYWVRWYLFPSLA